MNITNLFELWFHNIHNTTALSSAAGQVGRRPPHSSPMPAIKVLLLERDVEPRRKVGESLMPETYWVFERLGVLPGLKNGPFVEKVGVQFVSSSGKESSPFVFTRHDPRECGRTWHVERAKFDQFLLDNAATKGVEVHRGVRVLEVVFEGERAVGVRLASPDKQNGASGPSPAGDIIRAKVIVDASGQAGLLGARFGLRNPNPKFRKAAVWGHFRGSRRDIIENGVMTVCFRTLSNRSWFWHIPLSNDVVSIGVVGDADYFFRPAPARRTRFSRLRSPTARRWPSGSKAPKKSQGSMW